MARLWLGCWGGLASALAGWALAVQAPALPDKPAAQKPPVSGEREVTFLATSDSHYRQPDHKLGHHNELNRATIEQMNRITSIAWPAKLGGGPIAKPRGVVALGDLIDDGDHGAQTRQLSAEQHKLFVADFGLDGTDGLLKYPVFEGWGNHDGPPEGKEQHGFSSQRQIRQRNLLRQQKGLISNLSANGLHYAWDWDDVHFVQLNLYPADRQRAGYYAKNLKETKGPDQKLVRTWDGTWSWRFPLNRKLK